MTSENALVVRLRRPTGVFTSPQFCKLVNTQSSRTTKLLAELNKELEPAATAAH